MTSAAFQHRLQRLAALALPPWRLRDHNAAAIKQALDIGTQSLHIPMVGRADQAQRAYRAGRYPPEGMRGVGSSLARAWRFSSIPDYLTAEHNQICLILQIESAAGLDNLDAILAVYGVDGLFIGPSDLAADMRYLGQHPHPKVKPAVLDAIAPIRAAGTSAPIHDRFKSRK
jgi:4-hydroxy-2-oxoheptanedioate aldolase